MCWMLASEAGGRQKEERSVFFLHAAPDSAPERLSLPRHHLTLETGAGGLGNIPKISGRGGWGPRRFPSSDLGPVPSRHSDNLRHVHWNPGTRIPDPKHDDGLALGQAPCITEISQKAWEGSCKVIFSILLTKYTARNWQRSLKVKADCSGCGS